MDNLKLQNKIFEQDFEISELESRLATVLMPQLDAAVMNDRSN